VLLHLEPGRRVPVEPDEVFLLEADGDETRVRTRGRRRLRDIRSLGEVLACSPSGLFVQVHRSIAVNAANTGWGSGDEVGIAVARRVAQQAEERLEANQKRLVPRLRAPAGRERPSRCRDGRVSAGRAASGEPGRVDSGPISP
jgi:hypothetical protein